MRNTEWCRVVGNGSGRSAVGTRLESRASNTPRIANRGIRGTHRACLLTTRKYYRYAVRKYIPSSDSHIARFLFSYYDNCRASTTRRDLCDTNMEARAITNRRSNRNSPVNVTNISQFIRNPTWILINLNDRYIHFYHNITLILKFWEHQINFYYDMPIRKHVSRTGTDHI